jgi:hypothetical protein
MRLRSLLLFGFVHSGFLLAAHGNTLVEFSIDEAPLSDGAVGTCEYGPTDTEKPFLLRLSEEGRSTIETRPDEWGEPQHFTLHGHQGEFVSWFGIVRHITRIGWPHHGRLLLQNTYFSQYTDCHTQTVEINGGGDFQAELSDLPDDVIPLVLVRVYGVVRQEIDGCPVISAEYVRVWHFFQFNFMDFGLDHSNPEWRNRIKLDPGERIYHIGVSPTYYAERLGPTSEQWQEIREYHRAQTELEFQREGFDPLDSSTHYKPTESEADYVDLIPEKDRITVKSRPDEPVQSSFQLKGDLDRRVSWFGIVREVTPDGLGKRGGRLLIENKYFNGNKDEKLQTVSIHGGGDFLADVTNLSEELAPMLLVRVYGRVVREENGVPVVKVRFLRGWHIGQYNFDDYGEDHSNPRWTKNRQLRPGEVVHQTKMSADYYNRYLGVNETEANKIREIFKWRADAEKAKSDAENMPGETITVSPTASP